MSTGYTYKVASGEMTDVKDFILECAKAFMVEARDPGFNNYEIPRKLKLESSYDVDIKAAEDELQEILNWSDEEKQKQYDEEKSSIKQPLDVIRSENKFINQMLDKVINIRDNNPNFPDKLIEFMESQLRTSLNSSSYFEDRQIKFPSIDKWYCDKIDNAKRDIEYYQEQLEIRKTYIEKMNIWLDKVWSVIE